MRRMLLLAGSVAVLALVAVVALSSGGPVAETKGPQVGAQVADAHVPTSGPFAVAANRRNFGVPDDGVRDGYGDPRGQRSDRVHHRISRALADRLDIDPAWMRIALGETKARMLSRFVDRGVIEAEERIALEACLNQGRCDPRAVRPAMRKLRADLSDPESLADRKEELLHALSRTLDQDESKIEDALHTQLDVSLSFAVRFGAITERARRTAVRCFDEPKACDPAALAGVFRNIHRGGDR